MAQLTPHYHLAPSHHKSCHQKLQSTAQPAAARFWRSRRSLVPVREVRAAESRRLRSMPLLLQRHCGVPPRCCARWRLRCRSLQPQPQQWRRRLPRLILIAVVKAADLLRSKVTVNVSQLFAQAAG
jgi:hypothetical protein